MIEVTSLTVKGQVTVPVEIRRKLGLSGGDKVAFVDDGNGRYYILNAGEIALKNLITDFKGAKEELGIQGEEDVDRFLKEDRKGR